MCRNIKTLFNFEPPATEDEIHASALQFVRKLSGFNAPSKVNEAAFELAVAEVSASARKLLTSLHTHAPARDREIEAENKEAEQGAVRIDVHWRAPCRKSLGPSLSYREAFDDIAVLIAITLAALSPVRADTSDRFAMGGWIEKFQPAIDRANARANCFHSRPLPVQLHAVSRRAQCLC